MSNVTNGAKKDASRKPERVRVSAGTKGVKKSANTGQQPRHPALLRPQKFRGIYSRVAALLGVDRSYVSRVASGERRSARVETALLKEIQKIEKQHR